MVKYTKHFLGKLEDLFKELEYVIRYEKGNFQSGYALVEQRSIIVINKFFDVEGRINTLLDILHIVEVDTSNLDEKQQQFFKKLVEEKTTEEQES